MPFNIVNKKLTMRVAVFLRSTTLINNSPDRVGGFVPISTVVSIVKLQILSFLYTEKFTSH